MNRRKYKNIIILAILLLYIFFEAHLFWLIPNLSTSSLLTGGYLRLIMASIGIVLFLYFYCIKKEAIDKFNIVLCLYSSVYLACIYYYSYKRYTSQSIIETISLGTTWLYVFWIIPIAIFLYRNNQKQGIEIVFEYLNILSIIWCLIRIIACITYKTSGKLPFDFSSYVSLMGRTFVSKGFGLRITSLEFANVSLVYCIYKVVCAKSKKRIHFVGFILGTVCTIFVQQTRGYYIAFIFILMYAIYNYKIKTFRRIYRVILVFSSLVISIGTNFLSDVINSFYSGRSIYGTQIRLKAIEYYINCFKNNVFFGNGFAGATHYYHVEHGGPIGLGVFYYSDVGIVGSMGQTGLFGVIFLLIVIIRMIVIINKFRQKEDVNLLIMLLLFVLVTSPTLIITYTANMFMLVVIMGYFEAYHRIKQIN